jgi:hypothetical protein
MSLFSDGVGEEARALLKRVMAIGSAREDWEFRMSWGSGVFGVRNAYLRVNT